MGKCSCLDIGSSNVYNVEFFFLFYEKDIQPKLDIKLSLGKPEMQIIFIRL